MQQLNQPDRGGDAKDVRPMYACHSATSVCLQNHAMSLQGKAECWERQKNQMKDPSAKTPTRCSHRIGTPARSG